MLERKLIAETSAPWVPQMVVYEVTGSGLRFAAARLLKPISRQRADHVVRGLLARVEEVNARDELTHFVGEVRAFGSYITDSPELGDIDLSISFLPKPPPSGVGYIEWYLERAERSGRHFGSYIDRLLYCEGEVRRIVKARNRYVSIHPLSDLDELNIESRELYKSPIRPIYSPGAGGSSMP
jgi:hypothetical protein